MAGRSAVVEVAAGHPLSRLKRGPKGHLADAVLGARLVGAAASGLGSGSRAAPRGLGRAAARAVVRVLLALDIRVYAQSAGASVRLRVLGAINRGRAAAVQESPLARVVAEP